MKKCISVLLAALLILALAACGRSETPAEPQPDESAVESALDLLTQVWDSYADDERFSAVGGDMEGELATDMPGRFKADDAQALDSRLGLPADSVDKIDEAASLIHMLNANTFTCGAFHVKDAGDMDEIVEALKDNLLQRQWMCGFPDKLVIVKLDSYVVSVFGHKALVDTFAGHLGEVFPTAETAYDGVCGPR